MVTCAEPSGTEAALSTILRIFLVLVATAVDLFITIGLAIYHVATLRRADQIPDDMHGFLHRLNDRILGACMRR